MTWKPSEAPAYAMRQIRQLDVTRDLLVRLFGTPKRSRRWEIGEQWMLEDDEGHVASIYQWTGEKARRWKCWQVAVCCMPFGEVTFAEMDARAEGLCRWVEGENE